MGVFWSKMGVGEVGKFWRGFCERMGGFLGKVLEFFCERNRGGGFGKVWRSFGNSFGFLGYGLVFLEKSLEGFLVKEMEGCFETHNEKENYSTP